MEITRCDDCGPGTKLLGSLDKLKNESLLILVDDDNIYAKNMIESFYHYYSAAPENAYSFYVHPLKNFGVGQGADGFAINNNFLKNIKKFYDLVVNNKDELFEIILKNTVGSFECSLSSLSKNHVKSL